MTFFADFTSGQSNVSYTRMRQLLAASGGGLQEGVIGAGDLKISQRAAGANMSVDVAVGDAWIQYDTGARNGLSHVWSDAIANVTFNASDATNPRIDQIGVQLNDVAVGAGTGGNTPALRYLPGTATAGAQAANPAAAGYRAGAAATPNDWMRVADVLVRAASTSILSTDIVDRRPWARGAYRRLVRNANAAASNDYTFTTATLSDIDATNLSPRIECSGSPLRVSLRGRVIHSTAGGFVGVSFTVDGAYVDGATSTQAMYMGVEPAASGDIPLNFSWEFLPAAGSHVIRPQALANAATGSILARAANPLLFTVEEIVRPNADNT